MRRSTDRILTTHTGSMPRPAAILEAMRVKEAQTLTDERELQQAIAAGGAPAMQDLLGAQIPCIITALATAAAQARAGKIRVLAHSGLKRVNAVPDIPTFVEQGYHNVAAEGDFLIAAQSSAPAEVVKRVSAAIVARVRSDEFRAAVEKLGQAPLPATPAELTDRMKRNHAMWTTMVQAANFKAIEE